MYALICPLVPKFNFFASLVPMYCVASLIAELPFKSHVPPTGAGGTVAVSSS